MKIAMLAPIAWRTPPRHYGPWELVTSLLTEELVKMGLDVTLFATADSITKGKLRSVAMQGYEEDREMDAKVWECLHIAQCFEQADEFDIIHNHFDFLPLTYSKLVKTPMLTTIHGFSSPKILEVYKKYNANTHYVAISEANKSPELDYVETVYHGIDLNDFEFKGDEGEYLLFYGRIHPDKGTKEAVEMALALDMPLIIAGIIQDQDYYDQWVKPFLKKGKVEYVGSIGPERRNECLGNAKVLLHPIHFEEPFGLSVVEAMACGTPVLAFNKGSMPELIHHGENGFIVQDMEEACAYISKVSSISRMKCREIVEQRFSKEIMAQRYLEVYKRLIIRPESAVAV
jgi:glycosyltransferase involved in cell wall biosynthesis